jgi:UrcA family protein
MPAVLRFETLIPERGVQGIVDATEPQSPQGTTVMKTFHLNPLSFIFAAASMMTPIVGICADPAPQVRVSIADVNLSSPQGIERLYSRLRQAAAEVCGYEPEIRELSQRAAWSKCVDTALDGAVVQVRSIGLAALHAKRVGRTPLLLVAKSTPEGR